jgi:hypothetical protein
MKRTQGYASSAAQREDAIVVNRSQRSLFVGPHSLEPGVPVEIDDHWLEKARIAELIGNGEIQFATTSGAHRGNGPIEEDR